MKRKYIKIYLINILLFYSNIFVFAGLQFDNKIASFILKNSSSKIQLNPSTAYGWKNSSIVNKVSGIGLGDYNLKQYDYDLDNIITYTDVSNSMKYTNWNIPENTIVHIKENILMDGYGGTINLGENSQIFVDDNVTLTLRNVFVSGSKNGVGNPFIKLASHRSKLALDNAILKLANDFYFDRGQLFVYNDVNICGTNSFIYRSTMPSHITSGANLNFNPETTFDFRPSTTGTPNLLAKDLLIMQDATSQLYLDGCSVKTTMTGMRLSKGQLIFDNKISITSAAQLQLKNMGNWVYVQSGGTVRSVKFSPNGRYLAAGYDYSYSGYDLYVYDLCLNEIDSKNYGGSIRSIDWSPDNQYLAVGGDSNSQGDELQIYKFDNSELALILSHSFGHEYSPCVYTVSWSPDGQYLTIGGQFPTISDAELQIYRFSGSSLTFVTSKSCQISNGSITSSQWSPDGRYLAIGEYYYAGGTKLRIYGFDGSSLAIVSEAGDYYRINSIDWSPDGRYLVIGASGEIQVYYFSGTSLSLLASQTCGNYVESVNWSPDKRYIAAGIIYQDTGHELMEIYSFNGSSLTITTSTYYGGQEDGGISSVNFSPDGKYLAIGGGTILDYHGEVEIYTLQYGPETQTQAISNSIVFGNSALGSDYDLSINMRAGTNVEVDGIVNYDNVN